MIFLVKIFDFSPLVLYGTQNYMVIALSNKIKFSLKFKAVNFGILCNSNLISLPVSEPWTTDGQAYSQTDLKVPFYILDYWDLKLFKN